MTENHDVLRYNQSVWDKKVEQRSCYTVAVSEEVIADARRGKWQLRLTPTKSVPPHWLGSVSGRTVLCLASGGGQQGPVLSAAGADVTVLDISARQLEQDQYVARRDGLSLAVLQRSMDDLSCFADESFDLIFHPVANLFIPDLKPLWKEAYRVLRRGGVMLAGFMNPVFYLIDYDVPDARPRIEYPIPFSVEKTLAEEERRAWIEQGYALEYGHTLEDQIGGQIDAGFVISGFYEDNFGGQRPLDQYISTFIATRAVKS